MENKFKLGDKVRVINPYLPPSLIGVTGTISGTEIKGDSVWCNDWSNGTSGYMLKKNLELIEPESKFKIGDRVRVVKIEGDDVIPEVKRLVGKIGIVSNIGVDVDGEIGIGIENDIEEKRWFYESELELVEPKEFIVHCPTKQDFIDVQKKMFNEGYEWWDDDKNIKVDKWDTHREKTCIRIAKEEKYQMLYCDKPYYQQRHPNIPIISANQYLNKPVATTTTIGADWSILNTSAGKFLQGYPCEDKSQKKKIMSIIKDAFKSEDKKALAQYNIANGDGGLTADGVHEFVHYLWETNKEARKGFTKKVVERYKEDKKK